MEKGRVAELVDNLINQDIVYRMAISRGIVNYSSLARKMKGSIDKILGTGIPLNTIVKALTRMDSEKVENVEPYDALSELEISLEYGLVRKTVRSLEDLQTSFLTAFRSEKGYDVLCKDEKEEGLALLRMRMRERFTEIPGITVLIISILETFGIEIRYIYRFGHEIWFLMPKYQGTLALEKLASIASRKSKGD
ncbi:MAG: hypothetical protein ACP5UO_05630 [Thermoplasmata archaeon]